MSGSFGLTTPHPHFDCLDNLSTKTTWQMKAILCGQTILPTRVLKGHTQVMTSSEIFHAEQPKLSWAGFFFLLSLLFCKNLLSKLLMEGIMLSGNVLHQAQAWLLYLLFCLPPFVAITCPERSTGEDPPSAERLFWSWSHYPECWLASEKEQMSCWVSPGFYTCCQTRWLCPAEELHGPSSSSLIFGHGRITRKSYRWVKFCALNAYMSLPLTSARSLVYMAKVDFSGSLCWMSVSLVVGGMRQQLRMAWFQLQWTPLPCLFILYAIWIVRYFREKDLLEVLENLRWKWRPSKH